MKGDETTAWIGLGSNLHDPVKQLHQALRRVGKDKHTRVTRVSSFYRTPPWGDEQQDDFINAVAEVRTSLEPFALLQHLRKIEILMGRERGSRRWGPRVIDLDILMYGDIALRTAELVIPHARMHERAFVLVPLSELDDKLDIPGHGNIGNLLKKLDVSNIRRLQPGQI
jgi:2-amino-4-hydroxy-6-hydroxymethyldihydropteridine diphosphokinase